MRASEKLKALDERATSLPWEYHAGLPPWEPPVQMTGSVWARDDYRPMMEKPRTFDAELIVALRNALPQIVAVVEADNELAGYVRATLAGHDATVELTWALEQRDEAIAALEEALS